MSDQLDDGGIAGTLRQGDIAADGRVQLHPSLADGPADQRAGDRLGQGTDLIFIDRVRQDFPVSSVDGVFGFPVPDGPDGDADIVPPLRSIAEHIPEGHRLQLRHPLFVPKARNRRSSQQGRQHDRRSDQEPPPVPCFFCHKPSLRICISAARTGATNNTLSNRSSTPPWAKNILP